MTDNENREARAWLTLMRAPGVGAARIDALLERFGSPANILDAGRPAWRESGLDDTACSWLARPDEARIDEDMRWLAEPDHHLLPRTHPGYPLRLREIARPPPALFVVGDPQTLAMPQIAVVGSRNPTDDGWRQGRDFARYLSECGLIITSGLATGIDAAAHRGALEGKGVTVAVCGTGLDRVYPARHRELAHAIADQGALISEFPPGTPPRAHHFPQRNRILSGMALGVLVIEAARRSGSLITARMAMEQGREVFAMPGSIHNPLARGCHRLIREGAKLVECADDILEELGPLIGQRAPAAASEVDAQAESSHDAMQQSLLNALAGGPKGVDELVERTELTPETVSSMLLTLELQGWVASAPGGAYIRVK